MTWKTTKAKYDEHNNLVHCTGALRHFLKVFSLELLKLTSVVELTKMQQAWNLEN